MFAVVLAAESDGTGRSIAFLIACLLAIATIMAALTIWYWRFTSPKRVAERMALSLDLAQESTVEETLETPPMPTESKDTEPIDPASREPAPAVAATKAGASDQRVAKRTVADAAAITDAVRRLESTKPTVTASANGNSPNSGQGASVTPRRYEPEHLRSTPSDQSANGSTESDDSATLVHHRRKQASSNPNSFAGSSISDAAWQRITRSMLGGYGTERSET